MENIIAGMTIEQWRTKYPIVKKLQNLEEVCWINPFKIKTEKAVKECTVTLDDVLGAANRLKRFAAYFAVAFPETKARGGIIESPLREIKSMKKVLEASQNVKIPGKLYLKCDNELPISGSIKARGGIYEVLKTAEDIAIKEKLLHPGDSYALFNSGEFKKTMSKYSIAVGSTGNLGLSIGIMSAKLGFKVTVHMSADARQWKKDLLRSKGVAVYEYESDIALA